MRLAIISDVHADVHALRDALAQIDRLRCDIIVCAGDVIDYGLFPEETIALLRQRKISTIRGNHDRWAVGRGRADDPDGGSGPAFDASGWDLSRASLEFLEKLPPTWSETLAGIRVAVWHASPGSDMRGLMPEDVAGRAGDRLLDAAGADVLIVGHTHVPFAVRTARGGLIANPGALLRERGIGGEHLPRPGTFAVVELPRVSIRVCRAHDGSELSDPDGQPAHADDQVRHALAR